MLATFNLREARVNRGLSRRELAQAAGVGRETIRRLELGHRVHPASAKKVADLFNVQATDLLPTDPEPRAAA
jgi:transcriptional regulator with XRE-family HTH domain